ncbi:GNAT family protein [Tumebacillus sp. DT12]|uniref:GNAT family protein n=1 Tax=Tumebacillus lacus TaxID=2995335 RepID=A0ABT3WZM0_9BACL|nr:GNAT family protein [Tumebacillus lacus]MCX7570107.1 GNAT family protein [Tumebacillus lacus]
MLTHTLSPDAHLRLLEEADADELYALLDANRAHLRRWLPFLDSTTSPADSLGFIRSTRKQVSDNQGYSLAIVYKGRIVGCCGYHNINWINKKTSIGYWLAEDAQGKGLVTAAVRALLDNAFHNWGLNRVEIRAAVANEKSQAIPRRLGFTEEGIVKESEWLYDRYVDHIAFAMLAGDWKRTGQ